MPENEAFAKAREQLREEILQVTSATFGDLALKLFRFQARHNPVYRDYLHHLGCRPDRVYRLSAIPFLPVSFFKRHTVATGAGIAARHVFESSGTTGSETSRHYLRDPGLYESLSVSIFEAQYGPLTDFHILALLPSYLERNNSSLVYMVRHFMKVSGSGLSGFYLDDFEALNRKLSEIAGAGDGRKVLLIGVTFALLDWAEESGRFLKARGEMPDLIVMETGGMKGRRREMLRREVHDTLKRGLGIEAVHSEYGMTELVSQAYSSGDGVFRSSRSLQVLIRDSTDPLTIRDDDQTGGVNVIDLGNLDSCAFIETSDLGRADGVSGAFEIVGRFDNSDIRGCNLLYV